MKRASRASSRARCWAWALGALSLAPQAAWAASAPSAEVSAFAGPAPGVLPGWNLFVARLTAPDQDDMEARVALESSSYGAGGLDTQRANAVVKVPRAATVTVRLPLHVKDYAGVTARVFVGSTLVHSIDFPSAGRLSSALLFELAESSRWRAVVDQSPLLADPSTGGFLPLRVARPPYDPATGEPLMPEQPALYDPVSVVVAPSDAVLRLRPLEARALTSFVAGGGTLALHLSRPDDARSELVRALLGGEPRVSSLAPITLGAIDPGLPSNAMGKMPAQPAEPRPDTREALRGYAGGNLEASPWGATATYGLGQVHLLAFDPWQPDLVADPWVVHRMLALAKQAHELAPVSVRRAEPSVPPSFDLLDPNFATNWATFVALLVLLGYSVAVGPVNFALARRASRPLLAFARLPLFAAGALVLLVVLTSFAKGSGKVMRLSLVELGAGMGSGVVRGYRSYFTPRASEVTARPSDPAAVVSLVRHARANSQVETTAVDREGARLAGLRTKPWEAVVVREDGVAELGAGVTIAQEGATDVRVVNRTGRRLVGALLVLPSAQVLVLGDLAPGASILASAARSMGAHTGAPPWGMASASLEAHEGLVSAWDELAKAMPGTWLPTRVPVLLAQVEGGASGARQAGLPVVGDRLLLRVVGWGVSRE